MLAWALQAYGRRFGIATSFQAEEMVLVDMVARIDPGVRVFTLDTGRLPEETYQMLETTRERYGVRVEVVFPDAGEVERMTTRYGANLFYQDAARRKLCCHVRKTRPLERKLAGFDCWATGLRRMQSAERANLPRVEQTGERLKLNPLSDWSDQRLEEYVASNHVPRHPLLGRGYPSIGCAPCTRPVQPGEDARAGRWWWEQDASKECGIHVSPAGEMRRTLDVLLEEILIH